MTVLTLLKLLHVLSIIIWIGGMAFAHFCLRPAVAPLPPPERLKLLHAVLQRFFHIVLWTASLTVASGMGLIAATRIQVMQTGGVFLMPLGWIIMAALGIAMFLIFGYIRFMLHPRLTAAVNAGDWPAGGAAMAAIRAWVATNLALGIAAVVAAMLS